MNKPTLKPSAMRIEAIIAAVEPFPFVPPTRTDLKDFCGSPMSFKSLRMFLKPSLGPSLLRLYTYSVTSL